MIGTQIRTGKDVSYRLGTRRDSCHKHLESSWGSHLTKLERSSGGSSDCVEAGEDDHTRSDEVEHVVWSRACTKGRSSPSIIYIIMGA